MYRSIEDFIKDWDAESIGSVKIFSSITESTRNTLVHSNVRSLARLAWHLNQTISEMGKRAGLFNEDTLEHSEIPPTLGELLETYKKYAELLSKTVRSKWTDSSLLDKIEMYGQQWEKGKILRVLIAHQTHHRGQMTVIMRMLGLPVAGLYGPSKEEWAEFGMSAPV
ncbi:DinB family protein [Pedobacter nyackensis]|uniref:DinB family protein n=1 Tax=Pedobacter nyackensis TaxID=475255 RepID=UPI00292E3CDF|nr:DinB family protein [Pedobacter nyackensis]